MSEIKAFIFDQDGVIVDTERDGHRVAFNRTFAEFGFDVAWDVDEYHQLLQVGGGKERMTHYLQTKGFGVEVKPEETPELIRRLHRRKTDLFIELIESGALPLQGVRMPMSNSTSWLPPPPWAVEACCTCPIWPPPRRRDGIRGLEPPSSAFPSRTAAPR